MAFVANGGVKKGSTFGNLKVAIGVLTCSGNGVADSVGLNTVYGFSVAPKSSVTAGIMLSIATGGKIQATSASTGVDYYITAFGK